MGRRRAARFARIALPSLLCLPVVLSGCGGDGSEALAAAPAAAGLSPAGSARPGEAELRAATVAAMAARDAAALADAVRQARRLLGERAGIPEVKERFQPIPSAAPLQAEEARSLAARALPRLETLRWWRVGMDPLQLGRPLREPAAVLVGALALGEAAGTDAARRRALAVATDAGEFLLWAQAEAGGTLCPFPASRGVADSAPFKASARFLKAAEREDRLQQVTRNGWIAADLGDGLQFDNGECGAALLALHAASGEARWLDAARRMGEWAIAQPLSVNWNYNAFSVYLLAELYAATGETRWLDAALDKARFGVIPGQLRDGAYAGRWLDPHNARPAYHYILLRGLAALAPRLPAGTPERVEVETALSLGLAARNRDFTGPGAANKDHALQALLMVDAGWRTQPAFLASTGTDAALAALDRLAAHGWRNGRDPLGPHAAGLLLAHVVRRGQPSAADAGAGAGAEVAADGAGMAGGAGGDG